MERCRKHIAQIVKFNEDRFRYDFSLRYIVDNIEVMKKWTSVKQMKEIKERYELAKQMNNLQNNKPKKNIGGSLVNKSSNNSNKNIKSSVIKNTSMVNRNKQLMRRKTYTFGLKNKNVPGNNIKKAGQEGGKIQSLNRFITNTKLNIFIKKNMNNV